MINIIMPIYNGVEFISTPLDSLVKQTIDKDQFIVTIVQDFDGLDYMDIIKEYEEKGLNINFIKANHHLTQGPARQEGIDSLPNADYIMFIDQDDYLYKNAIKQLSNMISKTNSDIVFSSYIKETKEDEETVNQGHSDILTQLHGKIFSKKFLDENEIRFFDDLQYAEDSSFNLMAFYSTENKQYLNEITYYWNYNKNSQSRNDEMAYLNNMYSDYIIGQLRSIEHIYNKKGEVNKGLVQYIISYIYQVINIENCKQLNNYKYRETLAEFGKKQFVKDIMLDNESSKYFASNIHGGIVFVNEPLFFQVPFDIWCNTWLSK